MSQLIKPQIKWTEEKIALLLAEYPLGDKKALAAKLGVNSVKTLVCAAKRFGAKSIQDKRFYKLKNLFEQSPESIYWLGYIIADGHIDKKGQLDIGCSLKDKTHLSKLSHFLDIQIKEADYKSTYGNGRRAFLTCQDACYGVKFLEEFKITGPKTYFPPDLSPIMTQEKFLPFFLGFFDGDGCFSKNPKGRAYFAKIEVYSSWLPIFEKWQSFFLENYGITSSVGFTTRGYAFIKIYKYGTLAFLKNYAMQNNLPVLERKWDLVQ